jgi:hypothetical protein
LRIESQKVSSTNTINEFLTAGETPFSYEMTGYTMHLFGPHSEDGCPDFILIQSHSNDFDSLLLKTGRRFVEITFVDGANALSQLQSSDWAIAVSEFDGYHFHLATKGELQSAVIFSSAKPELGFHLWIPEMPLCHDVQLTQSCIN